MNTTGAACLSSSTDPENPGTSLPPVSQVQTPKRDPLNVSPTEGAHRGR